MSLFEVYVLTQAGTSEEEKIAQRTRSKHPLHDVSITLLEAGLGTVEGEDPPTPRELDPDELWWHQWLNSLTSDPLNGNVQYTLCFFLCVSSKVKAKQRQINQVHVPRLDNSRAATGGVHDTLQSRRFHPLSHSTMAT